MEVNKLDSVIFTINVIGMLLGILTLSVAILCGFVGRNKIVNGCMNCGHK